MLVETLYELRDKVFDYLSFSLDFRYVDLYENVRNPLLQEPDKDFTLPVFKPLDPPEINFSSYIKEHNLSNTKELNSKKISYKTIIDMQLIKPKRILFFKLTFRAIHFFTSRMGNVFCKHVAFYRLNDMDSSVSEIKRADLVRGDKGGVISLSLRWATRYKLIKEPIVFDVFPINFLGHTYLFRICYTFKEILKKRQIAFSRKVYFLNPLAAFSHLGELDSRLDTFVLLLQDTTHHALSAYRNGILAYAYVSKREHSLQDAIRWARSDFGEVYYFDFTNEPGALVSFMSLSDVLKIKDDDIIKLVSLYSISQAPKRRESYKYIFTYYDYFVTKYFTMSLITLIICVFLSLTYDYIYNTYFTEYIIMPSVTQSDIDYDNYINTLYKKQKEYVPMYDKFYEEFKKADIKKENLPIEIEIKQPRAKKLQHNY